MLYRKRLLAILRQPIAKHLLAILATSYCLNRNDRVSSFYWTRESKQCFFTCFSHFSCYFLILVFSKNRYLLISLYPFGCTGIQFLIPFLIPLALRASTLYMSPHVSGTERMGFSKEDGRGNLVVASLPVNFPFSAFCRRFLLQTTIGLNTIHTFLSRKNPWTDTFLRYLGLAKLRSTARVWNPQGTSKLVNRLIVACLMTASLHFAQGNSVGLPRYKCFAAGLSTYPCHMACVSKSVTKDVISLSNYVSNSTEALWMRCAMVGADHSASLSRNCQGQVRKVVLLWYCFCCVK